MPGQTVSPVILRSLKDRSCPEWRKLQYHWCKHFTGLQNKVCKAGISYDTVRVVGRNPDEPSVGAMFPCVGGGLAHLDNCDQRAFLTDAEAQAQQAETDAHVAAYFTKLAEGICPSCGQSTEPKRQVGRCVYGACGCRLYQGRV